LVRPKPSGTLPSRASSHSVLPPIEPVVELRLDLVGVKVTLPIFAVLRRGISLQPCRIEGLRGAPLALASPPDVRVRMARGAKDL
jgi:hypothetical protein